MLATTHTSYWQETGGSQIQFPPLAGDIQVDVAIVGGGITGLTAAAHLKASGLRTAILEAATIGSGTTGFTSGHLDATTDLALDKMIADFGLTRAQAIAQALRNSIDEIEVRCRDWPDCEFRRIPSYQFTESGEGLPALQRQCEAARKLGYDSWFTRSLPLPYRCIGAVETASQGRFHSLRYLRRLAADLQAGGISIYEQTSCSPPQDASPCVIETNGGSVRASAVVVATHSPFLGISQLEFRVFPYQSYVIAADIEELISDALYWDDADPYHYIRLASPDDPHLVLIGGADHKTGHPGDERDSFTDLLRYTQQRFTLRSVEQRWSAQYFIPADGLPHVGRLPGHEHVFIATGYAGTGLTWGTVAGMVAARSILGEQHALAEILNPGRMTLVASAPQMVAENLDVVRRFAVDHLGGQPAVADDEVPPGKGLVANQNGRKVALYRDPAGHLFRMSPVCTHAGCIVHWNESERTWDCPCHGGRFTAEGCRFAGPPTRDLAPDQGPDEAAP